MGNPVTGEEDRVREMEWCSKAGVSGVEAEERLERDVRQEGRRESRRGRGE